MQYIKRFRSAHMISVMQPADIFQAPSLLCKESFHIESLFVFEHKIDGAAQFMTQDAQGFALVVFSLKFGHIGFGRAGMS